MKHVAVVLSLYLLSACGGKSSSSSRNEDTGPQSVPESESSAPLVPATPSTPESAVEPSAPPIPDIPDEQPLAYSESNPGKKGRFAVRSYTTNLANKAYQSAIVYYPVDTTNKKFAATTLSGGYSNTKEYMGWLGSHLASHGIITIIFTPTNAYSFDASIWATGHKGALTQLELENQRSGSPIAGRVALDKLGIMGFSMGGAGTALAVNDVGTRVKAAVGLCAYNPAVLTQAVPTLHITGTQDTVASPSLIERSLGASKVSVPKAFAKFNGMAHQDIVFGGSHHEEIARYATSWYKVFLEADTTYKTYLNGEELKKQLDAGKVFAKPQDYFYKE